MGLTSNFPPSLRLFPLPCSAIPTRLDVRWNEPSPLEGTLDVPSLLTSPSVLGPIPLSTEKTLVLGLNSPLLPLLPVSTGIGGRGWSLDEILTLSRSEKVFPRFGRAVLVGFLEGGVRGHVGESWLNASWTGEPRPPIGLDKSPCVCVCVCVCVCACVRVCV